MSILSRARNAESGVFRDSLDVGVNEHNVSTGLPRFRYNGALLIFKGSA
jgi:hypothetical protein